MKANVRGQDTRTLATASRRATRATRPRARALSANPFAEEFDEEEVVLDSFAAWDDMFRRETPRVQNRRDPEFATLVQAAISTTRT